MKKLVLIMTLFLLTGCQNEKLECSKTSKGTDNLNMVETMNLTFKFNEVTNMSIKSKINIYGKYVNYVDDLEIMLKEQYKDLQNKKGISFKTEKEKTAISIKINANIKKMDEEAKKELSIINTKKSKEKTKEELENQGYKCK